MLRIAALVLSIGTLTAIAQTKPVAQATPPAPPPASAQPAAPPTTNYPPPTPEKVKELNDQLETFKLDQLEVQQAQQSVAQNDPVAKQALEILKKATLNNPDVKGAQAKADADRLKLTATITEARKAQHLDDSWDWDFNLSRFVQTRPGQGVSPAPAAKPAPVVKPGDEKQDGKTMPKHDSGE